MLNRNTDGAQRTKYSSRWTVEELPSLGDLDPYPGNNTPPLTTPLIVKSLESPLDFRGSNRNEFGIVVRDCVPHSRDLGQK